MDNVMLKLNVKLGGTNVTILPPNLLRIAKTETMIMGTRSLVSLVCNDG